jgi:hypothetical protein
MSNCFIGVLFDLAVSPDKAFLKSGPSLLPRAESGPTLAAADRTSGLLAAPASNAGPESFK